MRGWRAIWSLLASPAALRYEEEIWRRSEDIDTSLGAFPYEKVIGEADAFEVIAREALDAGCGVAVPAADSSSSRRPEHTNCAGSEVAALAVPLSTHGVSRSWPSTRPAPL